MSESFDEVCASYGDCTWIGRDEVKKVIARLQMAHEHELEQTDKSAYHRGYEDGKKSMDAEHRAMVMRLRRLRFDGDSHANLSKLAYSMYPCATGWTCESCEGLRDELIRLLGGIHDEPVPVDASGDADCDGCHRRDGESWRIAKLKQQRDGFKKAMVAAQDLLEKRTDERDELQRNLDSMTQEYLAMRSALDTSSTALRCTLAERDEARKKLDKIQGIIDASDKAHRDA